MRKIVGVVPMNQFRSCPFCGSDAQNGSMELIGGEWQFYTIHCQDCGALVTFDNENDQSIADVINRYNRRAGDDQ